MKTIIPFLVSSAITYVYAGFNEFTLNDYSLKHPPLPRAKGAVNIVPDSALDFNYTPDGIKKRMLMQKQQKERGYFDDTSSSAKRLMQLSDPCKVHYSTSTRLKDAGLKRSLREISLAFPFQGISWVLPSQVIAYAPAGMWLKKKGWTAVGEYSKDDFLGVCLFTLANIKLSGGSAFYGVDTVRYDINQKPTDIRVFGSTKTGFTYSINWTDSVYDHNLECANAKFDSKITEKMILLSKRIDKE